jgi:hypothetical protein
MTQDALRSLPHLARQLAHNRPESGYNKGAFGHPFFLFCGIFDHAQKERAEGTQSGVVCGLLFIGSSMSG